MSIKKEKKSYEVKLKVENSFVTSTVNALPKVYGNNSFNYIGNKKYIPFLASKDNLPNILLEARLKSVTHNACVSAICKSVVGKGLRVKEVQTPNQPLFDWFKCVNNKYQSIKQFLEASLDGERSQGNQFIEVKVGEFKGSKFMKVYNHSMLHCRLKTAEGDFDEPTHVIISKQIAKTGYINLRDPLEIPLWSPNLIDQNWCWRDNGDGTRSTMLHFKNEVAGVDFYGLPDSISGYPYQLEESKLVHYNIDNLDNNMILGGMLVFKSSMTRQEAEQQAQEILLTHVGEGKTGRIAVVSSEGGLNDVKFEQFNTQKEGSFKEREGTLERKIILANNFHPALLGLENGSAMGRGSSYIRGIYDAVDAQLFNPLEEKVIDKVLKPIVHIFAEHFNVKEVLDYQFYFESAMPYSLMADLDPASFTKVKEAREKAGYEADDKNGEKYLTEMKTSNNVQNKLPTEEGIDNNG